MISIKNSQRKIKFDTDAFKKKASIILKELKYDNFDLGILLTTDATIQKYNREFRDKDKPTDVLSFPYHETLQAGKRIKINSDEDKNLGDLIISLPYVFPDTPLLIDKFWVVFGFIAGITLIAYIVADIGIKRKPEMGVMAIMASFGIKMLFSMDFILVYVLTTPGSRLLFVFNFFSLYFLFSGFEIYALLCNLRHSIKK